jgi:hypothetical protein
MNITLLSCDAPRPDRRAIGKALEEIAAGVDSSLATELTGILIEGSPVEIELNDGYHSSGLKTLRKLQIDYQID